MKALRARELRNLTREELREKYQNLRKELFDLRCQARIGKLEKPSRIKEIRRDIARINTITREWKDGKKKG